MRSKFKAMIGFPLSETHEHYEGIVTGPSMTVPDQVENIQSLVTRLRSGDLMMVHDGEYDIESGAYENNDYSGEDKLYPMDRDGYTWQDGYKYINDVQTSYKKSKSVDGESMKSQSDKSPVVDEQVEDSKSKASDITKSNSEEAINK